MFIPWSRGRSGYRCAMLFEHSDLGRIFAPSWKSGRERLFALTATIIMHVIAIAWLVMSHYSPARERPSVSTFALTVIAMPAAEAQTPRISPPPLPTPDERPSPDPVSMTTGQSPDVVADAHLAAGCSPLEAVTKTITDDSATIAALRAVPRSERSISEAIVIWNAGWSEMAASTDAPLASVRIAMQQTLRALPSDCLAEIVAGPRLIQIATEQGTTFLAIGSGQWRWAQLIEEEAQSGTIVEPPSIDAPPFVAF